MMAEQTGEAESSRHFRISQAFKGILMSIMGFPN